MPKNPLEIAKEALAQAIEAKKQSKSILAQVGTAVVEMLQPFLQKLSADQQQSNDDLLNEIRNIEITVTPELKASEVTVNVPEIKVPAPQVTVNVPPIEVPEAKVTVKIPPIKVPEPKVTVNIPKFDLPQFPEEMEVKGWLKMQGFDNSLLSNPLPVQIRSADGTPVNWGALFGGTGSGGNGPRRVKIDNTASEPIPITGTISATLSADFGQGETGSETLRTVAATDSVQSVNVTGAFGSTVATGLINADNRLRVSLETGGSGLTDSELRATAVPVSQLSGANWSVFAQDALSTVTATTLVNADNRLRVSLETGGSGLTDSELRATAVPVSQVSGATDSVYITGAAASTYAEIMNPDGRVKVELPTGSSGLTDTELRASHLDVQQVSGAIDSVSVTNTVTVSATDLDIRDLANATDSVRAYQLSGASWSVFATNPVDNGDAATALRVVIAGNSSASVSATDLDIRDLTDASDAVRAYQVSGGNYSVYVTGAGASTFAEIMNPDGRVKVELPAGGSGLTDTELRATSVPVEQVSGSAWSTYVTGAAASVYAEIMNPDGRVKVELPAGGSGLTDTELRASHLDVQQLSGAIDSVFVTNTVTVSATDLDIRDLVNASDSVSAYQVSGANYSVNVTNTSIAVTATDLDIRDLANATDSIRAYQVSDGNYSVNVTNTVTVTGSLTSAVVVGPTVADTADDGSAPVQGGGIARTANPTAVANGDVVKTSFDDVGRQLMRPVQVRDLVLTAYVQVTNGTETTLRAAVAGAFLDCVMLTASNNSDAAVSVDVRAVTAGNIIHTMQIPAYGLGGWSPTIPWPQDATGNNWTVDLPDITGTTISFSALFSQEV